MMSLLPLLFDNNQPLWQTLHRTANFSILRAS
jgi:hypothetical protein